jgi:PQQ-dependent catabolism-associated CXXCW motif protein
MTGYGKKAKNTQDLRGHVILDHRWRVQMPDRLGSKRVAYLTRHAARNLVTLAFLFSSLITAFAQTAAQPRPDVMLPVDENYANERTDWGVPAQNTLSSVGATRTPTTIPGGKVLSTRQLADALYRKDRLIMLDAWADPAHQTIPGAHRLWFAGRTGSFEDIYQTALAAVLKRLTGGDLNYPVVVFCTSSECWESYNAVLRVGALGYSDIRWYRGGLTAWNAAHQPLSGEYGLEQFLH